MLQIATRPITSYHSPVASVAKLLQSLNEERLAARKRALGFIPKGKEGDSPVETLHRLVTLCSPRIRRKEFRAIRADSYSLSPSSTETALATLRSTGLIAQTGPETFEPTVWASAWVERAEPLELARILHAHIFLVAELVQLVKEPSNLGSLPATRLQTYVADEAPTRSEVAARLRILDACGLVHRINHTLYTSTPLGEAFAASVPCTRVGDGAAVATALAESQPERRSRIEEIAYALKQASTESREPRRLGNRNPTGNGTTGLYRPPAWRIRTNQCLAVDLERTWS